MNNEFYPVGIVKIYDANTSKLISEGHNMILQDGRDYIRNIFLSLILQASDSESDAKSNAFNTLSNVDNNLSKFGLVDLGSKISEDGTHRIALPLYGVYIGSDGSATVLDGNYKTLSNKKKIPLDNSSVTFDKLTNCLKLAIRIDSDFQSNENVIARELGIILGNPETENYIIFSRISFDPISLEAGSEVNLEYYIYF